MKPKFGKQLMRCCAWILTLIAAAVMPSAGAILYSNLGSPPQFDPENGWQIDGGVAAGQIIAVSFTATENSIFTGAQLPLGIIFSNLAQSPVILSLAADAGGLPGAGLADLSMEAGQSVVAFPPGSLVAYGCGGPCQTALSLGNTYWLIARIPDLNPDYFGSQSAWNWNTTLDYSTGSNLAYNDTQFGGGWQYVSNQELRPAFEIDTQVVPEPASFLLIAAGLGALGLLRRLL